MKSADNHQGPGVLMLQLLQSGCLIYDSMNALYGALFQISSRVRMFRFPKSPSALRCASGAQQTLNLPEWSTHASLPIKGHSPPGAILSGFSTLKGKKCSSLIDLPFGRFSLVAISVQMATQRFHLVIESMFLRKERCFISGK